MITNHCTTLIQERIASLQGCTLFKTVLFWMMVIQRSDIKNSKSDFITSDIRTQKEVPLHTREQMMMNLLCHGIPIKLPHTTKKGTELVADLSYSSTENQKIFEQLTVLLLNCKNLRNIIIVTNSNEANLSSEFSQYGGLYIRSKIINSRISN